MTLLDMGLIVLGIGVAYAVFAAWYVMREDKDKKTKWRERK